MPNGSSRPVRPVETAQLRRASESARALSVVPAGRFAARWFVQRAYAWLRMPVQEHGVHVRCPAASVRCTCSGQHGNMDRQECIHIPCRLRQACVSESCRRGWPMHAGRSAPDWAAGSHAQLRLASSHHRLDSSPPEPYISGRGGRLLTGATTASLRFAGKGQAAAEAHHCIIGELVGPRWTDTSPGGNVRCPYRSLIPDPRNTKLASA